MYYSSVIYHKFYCAPLNLIGTIMMRFFKLESGYKISEINAKKKMAALRELLKEDPLDLGELIDKCRDPTHELHITKEGLRHLETLKLMSDNKIKKSVKNLVLSVIKSNSHCVPDLRRGLAEENGLFNKPKK